QNTNPYFLFLLNQENKQERNVATVQITKTGTVKTGQRKIEKGHKNKQNSRILILLLCFLELLFWFVFIRTFGLFYFGR
ncbi:MAG: hypothetical protein RSE05_08075, partial [Clostridium sp.]